MSPNVDCYSEQDLIAYLQRTLPEIKRRAVESHLADCAACTKIVKAINKHLLREFGSDSEQKVAAGEVSELGNTLTGPLDRERASLDMLEPSQTVDHLGRLKGYDIIRVLGRGGYGVVFEALDSTLHRNVAIKVLTGDLARLTTSRRRFIREARASAAVNHPNVVTIHAVEESGAQPFIVMELIQGETLYDRIRREPKLDLLDILRIETFHPRRLAELSNGIPEFLDRIVARLLEKDREKRFQSAAEVADVLGRHLTVLNQTPTDKFPVALRMSMFEPTASTKRSRWPLVVGAIAILAMTAIAGGWFYFLSSKSNQSQENIVDSATPEPVPESASPARAQQRKLEVSVAKSGGADFTTIGETLWIVASGGKLIIQDDAEYTESILLADSARFAGLRIIPPAALFTAINNLPPAFTGNIAVAPSAIVGDRFKQLADVVAEFPLLSRGQNHPDFLKPDFDRLEGLGFVPSSPPGRYSASGEP